MDERLQKVVIEQAEFWSGVKLPNEAAREFAAGFESVVRGFEALRGTLAFEDEPCSFEAALQATKETTP